MLRVLVLIGAFLFFCTVLPNKARRSTTSVTPYMNGLDGTLSPQQVSSVLDETITYESRLARHRARASSEGQIDRVMHVSAEDGEFGVHATESDRR